MGNDLVDLGSIRGDGATGGKNVSDAMTAGMRRIRYRTVGNQ